jgi:DNA-binding NarL/FixJ family response regulator
MRTERLRVLVADDEEFLRRAIVRLLEDTFTIVGQVSTGRELVSAAVELRPDVIVSDLEMPLMTGIAAMEMLRATGLTPPFVLVTATEPNVHEWIARGVPAIVDKADLPLDLVAAVQSVVAGHVFLSRTIRAGSPT